MLITDKNIIPKMQTRYKINTFLLYTFSFFKSLQFFGSLCVPFYIIRLEFSYATMFAIETLFSVCIFLFEIPTGIIADKFGRKTSLFLGSLFFGLSFIFIGITKNIGNLAFSQILGALGMSLISGADSSLVYENAKSMQKSPEEISGIASRYAGFSTVAMLLAFPLGSLFCSSGILEYKTSLGFVFILTGISLLIASVLVLFVKETCAEKTEEEKIAEVKKIKSSLLENAKGCLYAFTNPSLRKLNLNYSVISAFTFLMFWFYQSLLMENDVDIAWNGFVAAGFNLSASLLLFASGFIQKKIGTNRTMFLSAFIPGLLYIAIFMFYKNIAIIIIGIFGITMLRLFRNPIIITQMNLQIEDENRATVLSGVSMFNRIIVAIFYPLSGLLMDKNPKFTYLIIGIATIICSILLRENSTPKDKKECKMKTIQKEC